MHPMSSVLVIPEVLASLVLRRSCGARKKLILFFKPQTHKCFLGSFQFPFFFYSCCSRGMGRLHEATCSAPVCVIQTTEFLESVDVDLQNLG